MKSSPSGAVAGLAARYGERGLEVAAVNVDSVRLAKRVERFMVSYGGLTSVLDGEAEEGAGWSRALGVRATPALLLFSRPECHLCEVAAGLLESSNLSWQVRNIDEDVELLRRYRIRIPVLYRPDIKAELFWPFGAEQLQQFLELKE